MAKIIVLGSSSKGNCYLLEAGGEILILEAGITFTKIKEGLNHDISKVVGCLVTHAHGDHIQAAGSLSCLGINVYASKGTLNEKGLIGKYIHPVKELSEFTVGKFVVRPFATQHDCKGKEPFGFIIEHEEFGRLVFATDTYYIKYRLTRIDHLFVECNYQKEILEENVKSGAVNDFRAKRLLKSHYEMSNLCKYLDQCIDNNTKNIVLLHLSSENSNEKQMIETVSKHSKLATVQVAKKGLEVDLTSDI